jgi:SAM-dependent methyltransferase
VTAAAPAPERPWAFWAPTRDDLVEQALDLASVGPGDSFADLGCGDGRVLVAAARRGAAVTGYEIDGRMAHAAERTLGDAGLAGDVRHGDLFDARFTNEVLYAYLTPALLVRLAEHLHACGFSGRLVTPRYRLTGWQATAEAGACFLYQFPLRAAVVPHAPGWPWRAMLAVVPSRQRFLVPVTFVAEPGALSPELGATLRASTRAAVGVDHLRRLSETAVDLRFEPCEPGSVVAGPVTLQGHELTVAVVYARSNFGQSTFGPAEGAAFREALQLAVAIERGSHE